MVKKLKSQFSFGFELEAILNKDVQNIQTMKETFDNFLGGIGDLHHDGSIHYRRDVNGTTFEYATTVLKYNPYCVNKAIKFLDNLKDWGVFVNSSCGFHTHISFPEISKNDVFWFIMWLCGTGAYHNFDKLGRSNLFNRRYASPRFLSKVESCLMCGSTAEAYCLIMTNDKYRSIRIHPQGTIEWRGPRTFLNVPSHKKNVSFFKKLDAFITAFVESMNCDSFTVNGYTYSKAEMTKFVGSTAFRDHMNITFKERSKNIHDLSITLARSPEILEKIPFKSLEKNKDKMLNVLKENYSVLNYGKYQSKSLLKFVMTTNEIDNKPTLIKRLFQIDFIINNADKLYENSLLNKTLMMYFDTNVSNSCAILMALKKWYKEGKYINAIKQLVKNLMGTNIKMAFMYEFVENGIFELLDESMKSQLISEVNTSIQQAFRYNFSFDTERKYIIYKLYNLFKEKGYLSSGNDTLPY